MMDLDSVPILADKEERLPLWKDEEHSSNDRRLSQRVSTHRYAILVHGFLVTAYILGFLGMVWNQGDRPNLLYSPARDAIRYTTKTVSVLYNDTTNFFLQEAGKGVEEAWAKLLNNLNIRMTEHEMRTLGKDSVKLNDGSGDSLVSIDVYHQLHCIKYLRSYIDGNPHAAIRVHPKNHAYHCIELLRQVIQCHGDISVLTYDWLPDDKVPMPRWETQHECVDWEALDGWAASRRVNLLDEGMVIRPTQHHNHDT